MSLSLTKKYNNKIITYRESIRIATEHAFKYNHKVFVIGQGVTDNLGFLGSMAGLFDKYPDRFIESPLSEDTMTGFCLGASLNGLYPIQTHMRVDFSLLCMNQIINLLAKYKFMYAGRFSVPTLIRMVIGRGWGQGAQHSQSLQSLFGHIPGLTVIMPASAQSILKIYPYVISSYKDPVLSIEHRLLYDIKYTVSDKDRSTNPLTSFLVKRGKDVTIVATSVMVLEALRAANYLKKEAGIECEIIDLNCISHPDKQLIINSVKKTGRLIVADTSWQAYGVCAEICRIVAEACPKALKTPVKTLGMQPTPCPTSKLLEDIFYPDIQYLSQVIVTMVKGSKNQNIILPDKYSTTEAFKTFKGPF